MKSGTGNIFLFIAFAVMTALTAGSVQAAVVPAEKVETAIIEHIGKFAGETGLDIEATVPNVSNVDIKETDNPVMNVVVLADENFKTRIPVRVEFTDGAGTVLKRYQYLARIKIFKIVAVAGRDLDRGESVTVDCIEMERVDVSNLSGFFEDPLKLEGLQVNRILRKGSVLTDRNVSSVPVISRGERVLIEVRVGGVVATAEGTARQDGGKGDTIRVYNDMTRTTLECMVLDEKRVAIGPAATKRQRGEK